MTTATMHDLIQRVRRQEQAFRLGHVYPEDLAYEGIMTEYERARADLLHAAREIRRLRDHQCSWDEDDYCRVCGADGRA